MISGKYRFHGYGALKFLFGHGKTWRFKSLSLREAANPRRQNSRLAVIVSKKVIKAAPKRNRIRRRVYEVLRTNWDHLKPGHDIVITIYDPGFLDVQSAQISEEIITALQRSDLWVEPKSNFKQE